MVTAASHCLGQSRASLLSPCPSEGMLEWGERLDRGNVCLCEQYNVTYFIQYLATSDLLSWGQET